MEFKSIEKWQVQRDLNLTVNFNFIITSNFKNKIINFI